MKKLIIISCAVIVLFNCSGCATLASYFVPEKKDNYFEYLNPMSGFNEKIEDGIKQEAGVWNEKNESNIVLRVVMIAVLIAGPVIGATTMYKDAEPHVRNGAFLFGLMGAGLGGLVSLIIDGVLMAVTS